MTLSKKSIPLIVVGVIFLCGSAFAEPSAQDRVVARGLFDQGRDLMTQNQVSQACPKFADSFRLDPKGGTLLNLAVCHEREGRTATAWVEFKEAVSLAQRDARPEREQMARERIAAIEPNLSRLTIVVSREADRPDLEIRLDGAVFGRSAWNEAMPLDPGEHVVRASAPGMQAWEGKASVGPSRDLQRVEVAVLHAAGASSVPSGPVVNAEKAKPLPADGSERNVESSSSSWITTPGFVVGGVGLAAGTVFGILAASKASTVKDKCTGTHCDPSAESDSLKTFATVSNISFGVGLIGIGAGVYGLLSAPSPSPRSKETAGVRIEPLVGPGSVHVVGSF